jgi:hypothetical protein
VTNDSGGQKMLAFNVVRDGCCRGLKHPTLRMVRCGGPATCTRCRRWLCWRRVARPRHTSREDANPGIRMTSGPLPSTTTEMRSRTMGPYGAVVDWASAAGVSKEVRPKAASRAEKRMKSALWSRHVLDKPRITCAVSAQLVWLAKPGFSTTTASSLVGGRTVACGVGTDLTTSASDPLQQFKPRRPVTD